MIDRGLRSTAKREHRVTTSLTTVLKQTRFFVLFDTFTGENCRVYAGKRIQILRGRPIGHFYALIIPCLLTILMLRDKDNLVSRIGNIDM